jgi:MoxR-like ATPase
MDYYSKKNLPTASAEKHGTYFPDDGLKAAIDVALELNMPLLLTGEPGTGKTRFAYHLAEHFGLGETLRFDAKTTSQASDLFYHYDALQHFHLVHNQAEKAAKLDLVKSGIIRFHALGKAIVDANKNKQRSVVLIDEIDKAPRDFPNDLLNVLEGGELTFRVPEMDDADYTIDAKLKPIVIITSNSEKSLPEPFLRRCIFYHIPFPTPASLLTIVKAKLSTLPSKNPLDDTVINNLITEFMEVRKVLQKQSAKIPATAELISWLIVLQRGGLGKPKLEGLSIQEQELLKHSLSILAKSMEARKALIHHFGLEHASI